MDQTLTPRIGIVTVCFHSNAILPQMLASIPDGTPVVLVDNAGDGLEKDLAALASTHGATLITNSENAGFGVACNQGAAALQTEFVLFLNPDSVLSEGALDHLIEAADAYPAASAFNPRIALPCGRPQFKHRSHLIDPADKMPRGWPDGDREVPVLSGAALLVRRTAFETVGGFDPAIFLYHEDDDLTVRLCKACGPLMFIYAAMVTHLSGESSDRSAKIAALKAWHMARSRAYATAKHGRPFARVRVLFAAFGQLLSPVVLLSKRKRAKQVAFLRGAISALSDGGTTS